MGPPFKEWPLFHICLALKKQNYISYLTVLAQKVDFKQMF